MFHVFGSNSGRKLGRDIVITVACVAIWIAFFLFWLTPVGIKFLESSKYYTPFIELFENTLNELNVLFGRINGLWFHHSTLSLPVNTPEAEYAQFTLATLFFDISKAALAALFVWLLRQLFSILFLYGKNDSVSSILNGNMHESILKSFSDHDFLLTLQKYSGKTDFLYRINRFLLLGIALFFGNLLANWLVGLLSDYVFSTFPSLLQHLIGLLFVIVTLVAVSLCFFLVSKKTFTSPTTSLSHSFKNQFSSMISAILRAMGTNLFMVLLFNSFLVFKLGTPTWIVLLLFALWTIAARLIEKFFNWLIKINVFYVAKKCPLSGLLGVVASVAVFACIYLLVAPGDNLPDAYAAFKSYPPFSESWVHGKSILNELLFYFERYSGEMVVLFITCNIFVVLQHLSSTYTATIPTQIVVRFIFLLVGALIIFLCYIFLEIIGQQLSTNWVYTHFVTFVLVLGYIIFAMLQPYWAIQGILTTGGVVLFLILVPASCFEEYFRDYFSALSTLTIIAEITYILASLLQNIVAFFEKRHPIVSNVAAVSVAAVGVGAAAVATANTLKAVSEGGSEILSGVSDAVSSPINNYCTKCGNKLSSVDKFCTKCGKKIP